MMYKQHQFVRHLVLLPGLVDLNIVNRYRRIHQKKCVELWTQVRLANEGSNSDVEFWRNACQRFKQLLRKNGWRSSTSQCIVSNNRSNDIVPQSIHREEQSENYGMREYCDNSDDAGDNKHSNKHSPPEEESVVAIDLPLFQPRFVVNLHSMFHQQKYRDASMDSLVIQDSLSFIQSYTANNIATLAATLSSDCPKSYAHWFEMIADHITTPMFEDREFKDIDCPSLVRLITAFSKAGVGKQVRLYNLILINDNSISYQFLFS